MTVLMGFADALAAPEVFFGLYHKGYKVRVFQKKGAETPLSKHLASGPPLYITPPEENAGKAVSDLADALRSQTDIDIVLALDDTSLWLANEALSGFAPEERRPVLANAQGAQRDIALDKALQIEKAKAAGLDVPPTIVAHSREEIFKATQFPAIVKPALAIAMDETGKLKKGDTTYIFEKSDLETLPEETALSFPVLVQPLIHGTGEGVFGFASKERVTHVFGHRRVRMMNPHGSGASACCAIEPSPDLVEKVTAFITSIGWQGPFMVELLTDDEGTCWFVELNGRMWGSTALSRRSGYDYAGWAVEQALDPEFCPRTFHPEGGPRFVRHLGRELMHLLFVIKGPKSRFHAERWPNLLRSIAGVFTPRSLSGFYNYDAAFPLFFLRDAAATVSKGIRRRKQ